jgi:uncharacterized phiE125 gp8 family phage protein
MLSAAELVPGAQALAEAKAYLRIDGGGEDALVAELVGAAAELCERFTGQMLIVRETREVLAARGAWQRLGAVPVVAIEGVETLPVEGPAAALPANAYAIDIDSAGQGWVRLTAPGEAKRIRVTYRAGLAEAWPALPVSLRQGVIRLAAHLYTQRDAGGLGEPPAAVAALWRPWRRLRLC